MNDLKASDADLRTVAGRYRFPLDLVKLAVGGLVISGVGVAYWVSFRHQPLWSHILVTPIGYAAVALFAWLTPMTVISETGIHRWWSTHKSVVPWSKVSDVVAKPVDRNNKYPVRAIQTNGDSILLIGVPVTAVLALQRLATGSPLVK